MHTQQTSRAIGTIARTCIAVRLRLLNRVVAKVYDDALRPLGVKVSQLNVLFAGRAENDVVTSGHLYATGTWPPPTISTKEDPAIQEAHG